MYLYIMYSLPIVISSAIENGAVNKTEDGSSFQLVLEKPIIVPQDASFCWVEVDSAVIWNNASNIIPNVNNKLYFTYKNTAYTISLNKGQYDLQSLNDNINREFEKFKLPRNLFRLTGDAPTQKIIIEYQHLGDNLFIDFTKNDTFRDIIGFKSRVIIFNTPPVVPSTLYEIGDIQAKFNAVNYFLIHTDLVNLGLRYNSKYSQIVSEVLIDAPAGSQIISRPFNVPKIPAPELIGQSRRTINVWLTDDKNKRVDTNGENFSFRISINYVM